MKYLIKVKFWFNTLRENLWFVACAYFLQSPPIFRESSSLGKHGSKKAKLLGRKKAENLIYAYLNKLSNICIYIYSIYKCQIYIYYRSSPVYIDESFSCSNLYFLMIYMASTAILRLFGMISPGASRLVIWAEMNLGKLEWFPNPFVTPAI